MVKMWKPAAAFLAEAMQKCIRYLKVQASPRIRKLMSKLWKLKK